MRNIISTVCLTFSVILGSIGVGYAHDGTYKITLDNWIKETPNIKDIGENTVTVKCNKRNNYNEIILLDSGLYPLIEFNQHIKNRFLTRMYARSEVEAGCPDSGRDYGCSSWRCGIRTPCE